MRLSRLMYAMIPALLACAPGLLADATVTACSSDIGGPGVNLSQALALGGMIYFQCPDNSVIRVTKAYTPQPGTALDGSNRVTLDGGGLVGPLLAPPSGKLTLRRIAIRSMKGRRDPLRALDASVALASEIELDHVTVESSEGPIVAREKLVVSESTFRGNTGWAVVSDVFGIAYVERSNFIGNEGGLTMNRGSVSSSWFAGNTGGGILVEFPIERVVIRSCFFRGNRGESAVRLSQRSHSTGIATISLRDNHFEDNDASASGGAGAITIYDAVASAPPSVRRLLATYPPCRFDSSYDRFRNNNGVLAGAIAADLNNTGGLTILGGLFINNRSSLDGGAVSAGGGRLSIAHSLFKANFAARDGAAIYSGDSVVIANTLMVENLAAQGAVNAPAVTLVNTTIANNESGGLVLRPAGTPSLISNSIFSGNTGRNCAGVAEAALAGHRNLQWGQTDCPGAEIGDPFLDTFYIPSPGSPVLAAGDPTVCRAWPVNGVDVVFEPRATNLESCSLGAYEHATLRKVPKPQEAGRP